MPIFKLTRKKDGARVVEAKDRGAMYRRLATEDYEIQPATIPEVVDAYHAHLKRKGDKC